jgi:hypothetical protein
MEALTGDAGCAPARRGIRRDNETMIMQLPNRHPLFQPVLVAMAVLFLSLPACDRASDCGVADQITVVDTGVKRGDKTYTLVRRISGFQDKVVSYELFDGAPVFDPCGRSGSDPVAYDGYDPDQGSIKALVFRNGRLDIVYTRNAAEAVPLDKLKLTVK